jgi:DNA-binding transcriptional ArsR family regulator
MFSSPEARSSAAVFAALGDETRLRLVASLSAGEALSIAVLTGGTRVTRQAVTKHLHVLERAGLARGIRRGRQQLWKLETRRLSASRRTLERISHRWDAALERLKSAVED